MSKRKFSMIAPALWRSKRVRALSSDEKVLLFYLLTSEHQNSAGCYRLPEGYVCSDLGWEPATLRKARAALVKADLVDFDPDTETVFICGWLKQCPPQNQKHALGTQTLIGNIESDRLRERAESDFEATGFWDNPLGPAANTTTAGNSPAYSSALANSPLVKRASGLR
ncbi:MAG TPA: hypothetical protein VGN97_15550 [Mesorhizobium sp.]|jgi:hypothetical protein|nr:hypothetical protein [Mesorhizobium sp.]